MGLGAVRVKFKKTHPAQWVGLEDFLKAHGLRSMGLWAVMYL
jgi:hypothetical protein